MKRKKNNFLFKVAKNAIKDGGDGLIKFSKPLIITDNTTQWNGTKYDIKSMILDNFNGKLTANHSDDVREVVGLTLGVKKVANKKVVVDGFQLAVEESALANFVYNMMLGGYLTDFSIETVGPYPDEDGVYTDAELLGLSVVVNGNNKNANIKNIALNSIKQSEELGLDTSGLDEFTIDEIADNDIIKDVTINEGDVMFVTIKNSRTFAVVVKYKNAAGDEVEATLNPGQTIDVSSDQGDLVKNQIDKAVEPETDEEEVEDKEEVKVDNSVLEALTSLTSKFDALEEKVFNSKVEEPQFKTKIENSLKDMGYKKRHGEQILAAWNWLKQGDTAGHKKLVEINKIHLEALQKENVVENSMTLSDFGNFVISPELLRDIQGQRSNYVPFLSALDWRETLSLQMGVMRRTGDINMQEVEMCDDGEDGNLKPVSEYDGTPELVNLHELAAVTPVCNAATRFLAVDLLGDVASGYRTDYDRKRAQLVIARLQQAIDATGNTTLYTESSDINALKAFVSAIGPVAEFVMNGLYVFNHSTYLQLLGNIIGAGISGPLSSVFTSGDQPTILGNPFIVVPNDLMPTLGAGDTKVFTVDGVNVTVDQSVFYFNPSTFTGRTSGGLQYDLSTEAAYEVGGETRSAYQRNELLLRGSFFRNGLVKDLEQVAGLSDFEQS